MNNLYPYLVFPGSCREAMEFYKETFHADSLSFITFKESPIQVDEEDQHRIFDSELTIGNVKIKASDNRSSHPVSGGNTISLFISFSDPEERQQVFNKLSEKGNIMFPLDENFGMLKDRFGINWMLVPEN